MLLTNFFAHQKIAIMFKASMLGETTTFYCFDVALTTTAYTQVNILLYPVLMDIDKYSFHILKCQNL